MDHVPVHISMAKPVQIHTRGPWVRVLAGTGTDDLIFTHGLPVLNTTYKRHQRLKEEAGTRDASAS